MTSSLLSDVGGVRLSCTVMTHPRRLAQAREIAAIAGAGTEVVVDPLPDGPRNPLRTAERAWSHCVSGSTHHLVIQDDVRLSAGFLAAARAAVRRHSDRVVALYVNSTSWNAAAARLAAVAGYGWTSLLRDDYFPTVAAAMPCAVAHEFAAFARTVMADEHDDDEVLANFINKNNIKTAVRVPNLVEHGISASLTGYDHHGIRRSVGFQSEYDDQPNNRHVETVRVWPAFKQRRALLRMPSVHGRARWQTRTRTSHLATIGVLWGDVREWADNAVDQLPVRPERRSSASRFLAELRLASLTLGWAAGAVTGGQPAVHDRNTTLVLASYIESGFAHDVAFEPWRTELDHLVELSRESVLDGLALASNET